MSTKSVLAATALALVNVHADIVTINCMAEAQDRLDKATKNTLVVYDVDEVLIAFSDRMANFIQHGRAAELNAAFIKTAGPKYELLKSKIFTQATICPVEPTTAQTITSLQARGIRTVALTKMRNGGPHGVIQSRTAYRLALLNKFGFTFSTVSEHEHFFTQLPTHENRHPCIVDGVMFANFIPKGPVLGAFLDTFTGNQPVTEVLFFDDELKNHQSVQEELTKRNIVFHGFHYKGAQAVISPFNEAVAQRQLDHLLKHEAWISEAEVRQQLAAETKT